MIFEKLAIKGAYLARFPVHEDKRGNFQEWFKSTTFNKLDIPIFTVNQANISKSKKGIIRGIHYSLSENGQAKWITCITGSILDIIVDLRQSSPTFMKWISVEINSSSGQCILVSQGLGHGFKSLENDTTISYLLSSEFSPQKEFSISPFDNDLKIDWKINPEVAYADILSEKDLNAPSLADQKNLNLLPQ